MPDEPFALFSRSGQSSPLGKCTASCKVWLPEEVDGALAGIAAIAGISKSEYVRQVLTQHTHGHLLVIRLQHQRLNGATEGTE